MFSKGGLLTYDAGLKQVILSTQWNDCRRHATNAPAEGSPAGDMAIQIHPAAPIKWGIVANGRSIVDE